MVNQPRTTDDSATETGRHGSTMARFVKRGVLSLAIAGAMFAGAASGAPLAGGHISPMAHSSQGGPHLEGPGGGC